MGGAKKSCKDIVVKENVDHWVFMDGGYGSESTLDDEEDSVLWSSSTSEMVEEEDDDASSSSAASSSPTSSGPLFELSELMAQLPIKKGLSSYYQGKSQSFTSLASVKSLEDLAKKESPYRNRNEKPCNKYRPRAIITKKSCGSSRGSFLSSSMVKRGSNFGGTAGSCRSSSISVVQKQF